MKWIGLTGGIASGKSTVAKIIAAEGFSVLDADEMARFVAKKNSPGLDQIIQAFGPDVLGSDGELDRKAMAQLVFSDKRKLLKLEAILHPLIKNEIQKQRKELEKQGKTFAFYDVPLLFEKKMETDFDQIILVSTDRELQISRMKTRNGFSLEEAESRLLNQLSFDEKKIKSNWIIHNDGSLDDLKAATLKVLHQIQSAKP